MTYLDIDPPRYPKSAAVDGPGSPFEQARDDQNAALTALDALVTKLATRLDPVLGPQRGKDSTDAVKGEKISAEAALVAVMRNQTYRIQVANDHIDALLSRLCI